MERYKRAFAPIKVPDDMGRRVMEGVERERSRRASRPRRYALAAAACAAAVCLVAVPLAVQPGQPPGGGVVATVNPVLTLDSLEALGETAPFPLSVPSQLPQGYAPEAYALLGGTLAEVRYSDGTDTITFRMAEGTEDVSGDFRTYAWQEEREGVTLKGEAGQVFLALWQEGAFRCSLAFSAGVTPEEALEAAQSLEPV